MSMTPSEDEQIVRRILGNPERWKESKPARDAAKVRASLDQSRATRAQSIIAYLTADRSQWPADVDKMLREELGINTLPPLPQETYSQPQADDEYEDPGAEPWEPAWVQ